MEIKNKLIPQAIDMEMAVLGAMLQSTEAVDDVLEVIKSPEAFYNPRNRLIFSAIMNLSDSHNSIDLLTVSNRLKEMNELEAIGGDFYLIDLSKKIASGAHSQYHAHIVLQKYMMRKLIQLGRKIDHLGNDESTDVFDLMDSIGQGLDEVNDIAQTGASGKSWEKSIMQVPKKVEFLTNNKGELTGVDTGLVNLNRHFGGWQKTDLIIIGADSGMGKTALAMTHLLAAAKQGNAVGMVSMEMSIQQLATRGVSVESDFHMRQLTQTGFKKNEYFVSLSNVVDRLKGLPIHIDDRPSLTVPEMKRRARFMKRKHDIQLFVVDFIQMFAGENDDIKIASIAARELKNIAKELDIPVIGLSQLSREVKKSKFSIPLKHHLKNSSGLEEAADVIGLLYRPSYYGYSPEKNGQLYQELNLKEDENAVFIVAKNRNGGLGDIPLRYLEDKTKFVDP